MLPDHGTTVAPQKKAKDYFSGYNQSAKRICYSLVFRTGKKKIKNFAARRATAVGVSPRSVSLRTVNHFNLPANVRCLILHVICGSETVSRETCCRCRGLEKPSQEGPQHAGLGTGGSPRCLRTSLRSANCRGCAAAPGLRLGRSRGSTTEGCTDKVFYRITAREGLKGTSRDDLSPTPLLK